jgi:hypothetical protein
MIDTKPRFVEIHEEGPREGFQIEPPGFSLQTGPAWSRRWPRRA